MLPSSSELVYFIEISQTLNLSRAAERLGISQPTLTLAVKRLEESFGLPLLIRNKAGVKLTHAGQKLVAQARFLTHEWDKIRSEAARDENEIRGNYVIGCHPSVAMYSLPSILPELLSTHESLEVKLVHDLSRRITEDVISFKVDFGIVVNPWPHPDLVIRNLCKDEVSLWVSDSPNELQDPSSDKAVLICDPDLTQSQEILKKLGKAKLKFNRTLTTSNLEVVAAMVAAKIGVGILPSRVALRLPEMKLKPLLPNGPHYSDKICLVFRADAQRSRASRQIAQFIEKRFNPEHGSEPATRPPRAPKSESASASLV